MSRGEAGQMLAESEEEQTTHRRLCHVVLNTQSDGDRFSSCQVLEHFWGEAAISGSSVRRDMCSPGAESDHLT